MDATLLRMAIAATGADAKPLTADDAWCSVTATQAERLVQDLHGRYRPDWRPFLLQLERHLETAPRGTATLLPFDVVEGGESKRVLLVIEARPPAHRVAFLAQDSSLVNRLRTLCHALDD
jgi:hypothetical protein